MKNKTESDYLVETNLTESYKLLSASVPISLLISTILAFIMAAVLSSQLPHGTLWIWLATIVCIHAVRVLFAYKFKPTPKLSQQQIKQYLIYFRIGVLSSSFAWGWTGYFLSQHIDFVYQVFIAYTLAGLAAGAASSLASDRLSIVAFIIPIMSPNIIFFFGIDNTIGPSMAMMMMLFTVYLISTARRQGQNLYENIQLRYQANRDEIQFREILNFSPIAAAISDNDSQHKLFINQSYLDLLEYSVSPSSKVEMSHYSIDEEQFKTITTKLNKGQNVTNQLIELTSADGGESKWGIGSFLIINYKNEPAVLSWIYDISERKKVEEKIKHLAYHDPLTQLPNRSLFNDRLQHALKTAQRHDTLLGIMFIDLDGFKRINDNYGHDVGDELLKEVAQRLLDKLRLTDTLSRLGGDEFVVLLPDLSEIKYASDIGQKILAEVDRPFDINGERLDISSSIGIAVYPHHGSRAEELLKNADNAMYYAKNNGKNNVQLYGNDLKHDFE